VTQPSASLRERLLAFAAEILHAPVPRETVAVTVARENTFTHRARTSRGLALVLDEPEHFGGTGQAPDPAEALLAALGASLSVTLTAHAALAEIDVLEVAVALSGDIDGRSFFDPRGAFQHGGLLDVRAAVTITSRAPRPRVRALLDDAVRASPVLRSLRRRPRVTLLLKRPEAP
jgi:pyruvate dehydrogenase E2 component (dihydrolipoamide acetyltransferase)